MYRFCVPGEVRSGTTRCRAELDLHRCCGGASHQACVKESGCCWDDGARTDRLSLRLSTISGKVLRRTFCRMLGGRRFASLGVNGVVGLCSQCFSRPDVDNAKTLRNLQQQCPALVVQPHVKRRMCGLAYFVSFSTCGRRTVVSKRSHLSRCGMLL